MGIIGQPQEENHDYGRPDHTSSDPLGPTPSGPVTDDDDPNLREGDWPQDSPYWPPSDPEPDTAGATPAGPGTDDEPHDLRSIFDDPKRD